ncbi:hypothetical protein BJ138DRAFT_1182035 [Hygrophoropsis aurantiaca]|uniref:Uncharacterized protein n=1 Tax=Hygrophoropsis aurantiaca TaxID=72124 RepID=A0ACB8A3G8_9AGAM|nr:hypothetical protein BJ138DRAFT_1182035 [Hygrophoropsis aurantiaca]
MSEGISDVLLNVALPKTSATLTLRVIKSFEYRTERSLVLHKINLETTTAGELKYIARQAIETQAGWKPYRNSIFDTLKLYTQAHGAKASGNNLSILWWLLTIVARRPILSSISTMTNGF